MTEQVKVELDAPHTHAGEDYAAGDQINVSDLTAVWLEKNGKGHRVEGAKKRQPKGVSRKTSNEVKDDE